MSSDRISSLPTISGRLKVRYDLLAFLSDSDFIILFVLELLDACRNYGGLAPARRITFEYVMLKGVNDSDQEARELVRLLKDFPSLVNLMCDSFSNVILARIYRKLL